MKVLLLAGIEPDRPGKTNRALQEMGDEIFIDQSIQQLESLGLEVVVVLAGFESEEILRKSHRLEHCELVYDTNFAQSTLVSNLRAGLYAVQRECFVFPITASLPERSVWMALLNHFFTQSYATGTHIVKTNQHEWPLLITAKGKSLLRKNSYIKTLSHPSLLWETVDLSSMDLTAQVIGDNSTPLPWTGRTNSL